MSSISQVDYQFSQSLTKPAINSVSHQPLVLTNISGWWLTELLGAVRHKFSQPSIFGAGSNQFSQPSAIGEIGHVIRQSSRLSA